MRLFGRDARRYHPNKFHSFPKLNFLFPRNNFLLPDVLRFNFFVLCFGFLDGCFRFSALGLQLNEKRHLPTARCLLQLLIRPSIMSIRAQRAHLHLPRRPNYLTSIIFLLNCIFPLCNFKRYVPLGTSIPVASLLFQTTEYLPGVEIFSARVRILFPLKS